MRIGMSRAEITPPIGTRQQGFPHFNHGSETILDDLEVQAFWLEDAGNTVCIITFDIIGVDDALTTLLQGAVAERCGISAGAVFLVASHNHSGPSVCSNLLCIGGPPNPGYIAQLRDAVVAVAERSKRHLRPSTLAVGQSSFSGYATLRRIVKDGKATYGPAPDGPRDDEVISLVFRDTQTKAIQAIFFQYTCHPTVMCDHHISADYPGAARRYVEKAFPGATVGFLPGCLADIRPNCTIVGGSAFRRGTSEDLAAFGNGLGAKVVQAVESAAPAFGTDRLHLRSHTVQVPLVDGHTTIPLGLHRLDLTDDVTLIGMGGEICADFGKFVKALRPGKITVPIGYVNGIIAYICPARYYSEGGYESAISWRYFSLPCPVSPRCEEVVRQALKGLCQNAENAKRDDASSFVASDS
jgi:neutral ceramidase